jgi:hypothetical protein
MLKPGLIPGVAVAFVMIATGQNVIGAIVTGFVILAVMTMIQYYFASRKSN